MTKCQCPVEGILREGMASFYNHAELPFVAHEPNQCKCTNELKLYRRKDGSELYLCSCCCLGSDIPVNTDEKAIAT